MLKILRARYIRRQKKIRTREIVNEDYDNKAWLDVLQSAYWEKASDLKHFLGMTTPDVHLSDDQKLIWLKDKKLVKNTISEIDDFCRSQMIDILKEHVTQSDKIVELGCGPALNLFDLRLRGFNNILEGYDVSKNVIKVTESIRHHFNLDNMKFGLIDLSKPFDCSFVNGKIIFTRHSFEQLRHYTDIAIKNILDGNPKQVLHFEPVPEILGYSLQDIVERVHNEFADYQNNLLHTLKKFEKKKLLRILEVKRLNCGANPFNESVLIRWTPSD